MATGIPSPPLMGQAKGVSYYWFPDPFAPGFDVKWTVGPPEVCRNIWDLDYKFTAITQELLRFKSFAHKPSKFLEFNSTGKLLVRKTGRLIIFVKTMGKLTPQNKRT